MEETDAKILFSEKNSEKSVSEDELIEANGDKCPRCGKTMKHADGKVVIISQGRLWGFIKETGQIIKKCTCKVWLKLPYKLTENKDKI